MTRLGLVLIGALIPIALGSPGTFAQVSPDSEEETGTLYTWEQAVALGLPDIEEHLAPPGMGYCDSVNYSFEGFDDSSPPAPDDAPECAARPEQEGLEFRVGPPLGASDAYSSGTYSGSTQFHASGGSFPFGYFEGGKILSEVSNPGVRHNRQQYAKEHFYSRVSAISLGDRSFEVGWYESNHYPKTGDDQRVLSVRGDPSGDQKPRPHKSWNLTVGRTYAFRIKDCSDPGQGRVCAQVWDGARWVNVRKWEEMRCEKADGTPNCHVNYFHEPFSKNTTWFNINGGSDGLRMREIRTRNASGNWRLFNEQNFDGSWVFSPNPYYVCPVHKWYHFRFYRSNLC